MEEEIGLSLRCFNLQKRGMAMNKQTFDKIDGLVDQSSLRQFLESFLDICDDLKDEGFENKEIKEYLSMKTGLKW